MCGKGCCSSLFWLYTVIVIEFIFLGWGILLAIQATIAYDGALHADNAEDRLLHKLEKFKVEVSESDQIDFITPATMALTATAVFSLLQLVFLIFLLVGYHRRSWPFLIPFVLWLVVYNIVFAAGLIYASGKLSKTESLPITEAHVTCTIPIIEKKIELPPIPIFSARVQKYAIKILHRIPTFLYPIAGCKLLIAVYCVIVTICTMTVLGRRGSSDRSMPV